MSRIGRAPIEVPAGVEFAQRDDVVTVKGPRGELSQRVPREMSIELNDGLIVGDAARADRDQHRSLHGLTRSLVANMVEGVTKGFEKRLEIVGVGYRASVKGTNLELLVGYSHPVVIEPPEHVEFETPQPQVILVRGIDKQVGRRRWRPRCAPCAGRSPTRARASATRASTWPAQGRQARLARHRHEERRER